MKTLDDNEMELVMNAFVIPLDDLLQGLADATGAAVTVSVNIEGWDEPVEKVFAPSEVV